MDRWRIAPDPTQVNRFAQTQLSTASFSRFLPIFISLEVVCGYMVLENCGCK